MAATREVIFKLNQWCRSSAIHPIKTAAYIFSPFASACRMSHLHSIHIFPIYSRAHWQQARVRPSHIWTFLVFVYVSEAVRFVSKNKYLIQKRSKMKSSWFAFVLLFRALRGFVSCTERFSVWIDSIFFAITSSSSSASTSYFRLHFFHGFSLFDYCAVGRNQFQQNGKKLHIFRLVKT